MMRACDLVLGFLALPLLGAALIFTAKAFLSGRSEKLMEYAAVFLGLGVPLFLLLLTLPLVQGGDAVQTVIGGWHGGVGILYRFDGLAWLVNLLGFSVGAAAYIYSMGAGPKGPQFSAVFLIQTAALAATCMTADLFNLFVCLEVLGISSYILVASSEKPGAFLASYSYLIVSAAAMMFFLAGLYGLYRLTGFLSYEGIARELSVLPDRGGITAIISLALVTAAVALRVAIMPLYGWLPDAHALAPHAVSAVLSGVLIKTPLFALSRILMLMPAGASAGQIMSYAGAVTALTAVVIALSQKDAKKLLAYHSISQIGYVVCAWGAAMQEGPMSAAGIPLMTAAFLHAFYHALFKGLLFLTVGTATDTAGERNVHKLRGAAAILRRSGEAFPVTLVCFLIGALAISAIPPLNGYGSKNAIAYALKGRWQYVFLYAASIGTVASFIKLTRIFLPSRKGPSAESRPTEPERTAAPIPRAVQTAQILLGALCVATGLVASRFSVFAGRLLAGGHTAKAIPPDLYSGSNLLTTAFITLAGGVIFLAASSRPGKHILGVIRERPRDFRGLFVSLALGTAVLALWMIHLSG